MATKTPAFEMTIADLASSLGNSVSELKELFEQPLSKIPLQDQGAITGLVAGIEMFVHELSLRPARIAELEAEKRERVNVNKWGFTLMDALGKFLEQALAADGPIVSSINCAFPDMPDKPVVHLWATTGDQTPVTRARELREKLDAVEAERDRLKEAVQWAIDSADNDYAWCERLRELAGIPEGPL